MVQAKKTVIAVLMLAITTVGSFIILATILSGNIAGAQAHPSITVVETVQEAESLAGYRLSVPGFLPQGLERRNIVVYVPGNAQRAKSVSQYWHLPGGMDGGIILDDDPDLDGLMGGKPVTIGGVAGERALHPATGRPYQILELFWKDQNGRGHVLTGSLAGSITEELLRIVAASVRSP